VYALNLGLAIGSTDLQEEVRSCLSSLPIRVVLEQREIGEAAAFIEKLERVQPDVVLLGYQLVEQDLSTAITQIKATAGSPAVILVNSAASPELILRGLRSGADEYVFPPMGQDLAAALDRIARQRAKLKAGTRPRGKVFAVLGAKGGCGATTVACHVALELYRLSNLEVLLADFDLDSGMIGFLMKSQSRYSLVDALASAHRLDLSLWKALVSNGHPGVEVLMAPATSGDREPPDPRSIRYIVPFVRSTYDWSVLDLGRSLSRPVLAAMQESDETLLVTTPDIPALHRSKQIVQSLLENGFGQHQLHVILNRTPKRLEVTLNELDRMLGVPVYATIHDDFPSLNEAYSNGALVAPNTYLGKDFARIAARMAGVQQKAKKAFGLFSLMG
jgi:pilus assembly protein CpaE